MFDATWPLWAHIVLFLAAGGAIGVAGSKLAGIADRLADRTGLGEAVVGTLFLGFTTALPGIATDGSPSSAPFIQAHELAIIEDMAAHGLFDIPPRGPTWQTKRGHIQGIQSEEVAVTATAGWRTRTCISVAVKIIPAGDADGRFIFRKPPH